jgi:hypothetical protein
MPLIEDMQKGIFRDLSVAQVTEEADRLYKEWIEVTGFVDSPSLKLAFDYGWYLGGIHAVEKLTVSMLTPNETEGNA